jgi:capsular exopolysaccharide synthesis family protein
MLAMSMQDEEIHLRDYLRVVSKRRGLVATFFIVTFVIVLIGTFAVTPMYKGTAKVMIEKVETGNLTNRYYYAAGFDPEFYETQFQLIRSNGVAKRVVTMLGLEENWEAYMGESDKGSSPMDWLRRVKAMVGSAFDGEAKAPGSLSGLPAIAAPTRAEILARQLVAGIEVNPVKDSRIVDISFRSPNPQFSALVANSVADAYIEEILEMKMASTRRTLEWMTKKAEEEQAKLEKAEMGLQGYMKANDIVSLENRIAVTPQKLSELGTQLIQAEGKRKELEAMHNKIVMAGNNSAAAETIPVIGDDAAMLTLRSQMLQAEQKIREMSSKFGEKHPVMIKALGDLELLTKKKEQEIRRIVQTVKNDYELALIKENGLRAQLDQTKNEAVNLNDKVVQYGVFKRDIETNRQIYDALLMKMKEQSITEETNPVNLWMVEKATVPSAPASPRKKVNLLLGLVVGLFGGIGLAFFVEYLDDSIKTPEEAEALLHTPVLGVVSNWHGKEQAIETVVLDDPRSAGAESFKTLRTALLLSSAGQPPKLILVTSSVPGEGKTTTSLNLALSMAQSGKRVLLIDGDMRKPRLHDILKLDNSRGLSTFLAGGGRTDLLQSGPLPNLAVITSGPIPPNPLELLTAEGLPDLLETLKTRFDFIICDSPPLLSVTDALMLSRIFQGTMVVARSHRTTYGMARRALKSLSDIQAPVLGIFINGLSLKNTDYYYNAYYGSYAESSASLDAGKGQI